MVSQSAHQPRSELKVKPDQWKGSLAWLETEGFLVDPAPAGSTKQHDAVSTAAQCSEYHSTMQ